jgi:hypothetical protein
LTFRGFTTINSIDANVFTARDANPVQLIAYHAPDTGWPRERGGQRPPVPWCGFVLRHDFR